MKKMILNAKKGFFGSKKGLNYFFMLLKKDFIKC